MKLAVTYDNGDVFQHFGHTEAFKIYEIEAGQVTSSQVVPTNGSGHGALAGFLKQFDVEALICGGIGGGAKTALAENGIKVYGGVSGKADDAVKALIEGGLAYTDAATCHHHDDDPNHKCGDHHEGGCGEGHSCH